MTNPEDLWFCVERDGVDFRVLGSQIHEKIQEGDKFVVWRDGKPHKWRWAEYDFIWEKESFWYHVKNLTEELFLWPRDEIGIIWDKSTGERVDRMLPGGEYMIAGYNEEGHKIRFEGNSGNWDFGADTNTSLLTDGRRFFAKCPNFNGDVSALASAQWSDISEMFLNCTSFNQPLASWDPSNIFNNHEMYDFLRGASSFDQDLSSWCMYDRGIDLRIVRLSADEWAKGAPIASNPGKHPKWQCYREETTRTTRIDDGSAI